MVSNDFLEASSQSMLVSGHSAHCRTCKERIGELLLALYGHCRVNHSFPWSALPQDYGRSPIGSLVERIRLALGQLRGHHDFIKSALVPPCDYFVSDPPFILEFDESQHFSRPRSVTLSLYPDELRVGFPVARWLDLCREIDAQDDLPFDRDERRAWYDTLRDIIPTLHGFQPTVRLYAGEFEWCSLDAASVLDQARFKQILEMRHK
jgi:hypothetical protein